MRKRQNIFGKFVDIADAIVAKIADESKDAEERAKLCRVYITNLNILLKEARDWRKELPAVSLYNRKSKTNSKESGGKK